ncbi:MAG TPA: exodeoxyribonuclease III, partial [Candidatus Kapabacteria bacterium]|nr:exodeoxyribonuclease III [Candidatus Kapabacteria bacterium]
MSTINFLSWNVNGIRAVERKGALGVIKKGTYDIVCLQETKISDPSLLSESLRSMDGYTSYWQCSTERKGYSGVATYTKQKPHVVTTIFGDTSLSKEGRVQCLDYGAFLLFNIYFPNGGASDIRLKYKLHFYKEFLDHLAPLIQAGKQIIVCGDVNTAHHEIDLARPKANIDHSGFMPIEREWLDRFEALGLVDTFRLLYPHKEAAYTWWDLKTGARAR